jgi:hypothetical protein
MMPRLATGGAFFLPVLVVFVNYSLLHFFLKKLAIFKSYGIIKNSNGKLFNNLHYNCSFIDTYTLPGLLISQAVYS